MKGERFLHGTTSPPLKEPTPFSNPTSSRTSGGYLNQCTTFSLLEKASPLLQDGFRVPWSLVCEQLTSSTFATRGTGVAKSDVLLRKLDCHEFYWALFYCTFKKPKKRKKNENFSSDLFSSKKCFFLEKRCFPPVCLISHSATCIDLGKIVIYVCNATVVPLSFKKTGDQTLGGI